MIGKIKEYVIEKGKVLEMTLQCEQRDFEVFKIMAAAQLQDKYQTRLDFNETKFHWAKL